MAFLTVTAYDESKQSINPNTPERAIRLSKIEWDFRRDDTSAVKGVAIVLMLLHHAFLFKDRIAEEFEQVSYISIGTTNLMDFFASYGKVCVAIFFFLSGLGLMKSCGASLTSRIIKSLRRIFFSYWKVLLVFVPIGFIFFAKKTHDYATASIITNAWKDNSLTTAVRSLFGMSESYNHEWWFISAFIVTILTMPFVAKILNKMSNFWSGLGFIAALEVFLSAILPFMESSTFPIDMNQSFIFKNIIGGLTHSTPFYMGMLMGANNNFEALHDKLDKNGLASPVFSLLALAASMLIRNYIFGESSDSFIVPITILSIKEVLDVTKPIKNLFIALGNHSTTMWLTHTFLLYYYCKELQGFIMFQHWWVITLVWFVAVSFLVANIFDRFISNISNVFCHILNRKI